MNRDVFVRVYKEACKKGKVRDDFNVSELAGAYLDMYGDAAIVAVTADIRDERISYTRGSAARAVLSLLK